MSVLIYVEEKIERKRTKKNDPRTCDIDIIDYNSQIINFRYNQCDFIVPHKKMKKRNFVLIPLKEICGEWIHPETNEKIDDLIGKLSLEKKKAILKIKKN